MLKIIDILDIKENVKNYVTYTPYKDVDLTYISEFFSEYLIYSESEKALIIDIFYLYYSEEFSVEEDVLSRIDIYSYFEINLSLL